jgi:hypothetical protein
MSLEHIEIAMAVATLTTLFTLSELFEPVRKGLPDRPWSCSICMTHWIASPCLYYGFITYLSIVFMAIVGVLLVTKTYNELADLDYKE